MIPEAPLRRTDEGLVPEGEGWFVVNAREARWWADEAFGGFTRFEGDVRFPSIGINIGVLAPSQPACMYHREDEQENFLVLSGECRLLGEGEERRLKAGDFVHCPPWTDHVFVGAGEGDCAILASGRAPAEASCTRSPRSPSDMGQASSRRRPPRTRRTPDLPSPCRRPSARAGSPRYAPSR